MSQAQQLASSLFSPSTTTPSFSFSSLLYPPPAIQRQPSQALLPRKPHKKKKKKKRGREGRDARPGHGQRERRGLFASPALASSPAFPYTLRLPEPSAAFGNLLQQISQQHHHHDQALPNHRHEKEREKEKGKENDERAGGEKGLPSLPPKTEAGTKREGREGKEGDEGKKGAGAEEHEASEKSLFSVASTREEGGRVMGQGRGGECGTRPGEGAGRGEAGSEGGVASRESSSSSPSHFPDHELRLVEKPAVRDGRSLDGGAEGGLEGGEEGGPRRGRS